MKVHVTQHAKGLLLTNADADTERTSTNEWQRLLKIPLLPMAKGGVIVPLEFAYTVFDALGEEALWDDKCLQMALEQKSEREDQLRARIEVQDALENAEAHLADYPLLDALDKHQIEAVAAISVPSLRGIAIFDEQGTGKTISALCGFDRLRQLATIDRLIIVAPKSVLGSWQTDINKLFKDKYHFQIATGKSKDRRKIIQGKNDILALSYETVVSELDLLRGILASTQYKYLLVVDESYYVKNSDARRTRAVVKLRQNCARAIVLCGTPAPNSPYDVIEQINIADNGVTFRNRQIPDDAPEQALPLVAEALNEAVYLRRTKQDVFPLMPSKQIEQIVFDLQPVQRTLYEQAKADLIVSVRSVDDATFNKNLASFLARRIALLQICSHPGVLDSTYTETPAKHLVLDKLLHELIEQDDKKVVLWSYFKYSLEALVRRYSHYGLVRIDGSIVNVEERIEAIHQFQSNPKIRIFCGNAGAAGAGITLSAAHHAIYESLSNQAAHYMQSVDRIHRRGQDQNVVIHVLLANATLEQEEFRRILDKEKNSKSLIGDTNIEPITRDRFLTEIQANA